MMDGKIMQALKSLEDGKPFSCKGKGRSSPLAVSELSALYSALDGLSVRVLPCTKENINLVLSRFPEDRRELSLVSDLPEDLITGMAVGKILLFYRGSPTLPNLEGWAILGEVGGIVLMLYCSLFYGVVSSESRLLLGILVNTLLPNLDWVGMIMRKYRLTHPYISGFIIEKEVFWGIEKED